MLKKILCTSMIAVIGFFGGAAFAENYKIGIQSPRGALQTKKQWSGFVKYIGEKTGHKFKIVPMFPAEMSDAISNGGVDIILANPVLSARALKDPENIQLAGLNKKSGDKFGGVIISKAGSGINTAADVKGKNVIPFKIGKSAGAYVFQVYHLKEAGVTTKDYTFLPQGKKQDDNVLAVLNGAADVAFVRTGILEYMEKEGKIKISDFTIIDKKDDDFPQVHSTVLYPEWQLIAIGSGAGKKIGDDVKKAALSLDKDSAAAKKARINGFNEPASLDNLINVLKDLKIGGFK